LSKVSSTNTVTSEQLLLEKWHELPDKEKSLVLEFVDMMHGREKNNATPSHKNASSKASTPVGPVPIPEAERQRIVERILTAQAERPQKLKQMKLRQQEGWEAARKVATMLKADFGVERAVLFGSLIDHTQMHERSDIDLAVWGLADSQFSKAWTAANYILGPYHFPPIDLVPIEKAYPVIREAIDEKGVEL